MTPKRRVDQRARATQSSNAPERYGGASKQNGSAGECCVGISRDARAGREKRAPIQPKRLGLAGADSWTVIGIMVLSSSFVGQTTGGLRRGLVQIAFDAGECPVLVPICAGRSVCAARPSARPSKGVAATAAGMVPSPATRCPSGSPRPRLGDRRACGIRSSAESQPPCKRCVRPFNARPHPFPEDLVLLPDRTVGFGHGEGPIQFRIGIGPAPQRLGDHVQGHVEGLLWLIPSDLPVEDGTRSLPPAHGRGAPLSPGSRVPLRRQARSPAS